MIIQCDKCATKFRLDDSRITPNGVKVRCTKCDNVFIVTPPPPPEEVQVEELFGVAPGMEERPARPAPARSGPAKPKEDDRHLAFDFGSDETADEVFKTPSEPASEPDKEPSFAGQPDGTDGEEKKFSLDGLDFSFSEDRSLSGGDKQEEDDLRSAGGEEEEDDPFSGAFERPAASGDEDEQEPVPGPQAEAAKGDDDELDFSFGDLTADSSDTADTTDTPVKEETEGQDEEKGPEGEASKPIAENVIPFSAAAAYTKEAKAPAPSPAPEMHEERDDAFKTFLTRAVEKNENITFEEPVDEDETQDEDEERDFQGRRTSQPRMGLIIAALVIVLGGGLIYFSGVIDRLTHMLMPASEAKIVEIESIKGFYEENRNFGKLFVIDARVKNITDSPQEIKAATGIIYDDSGKKIAERSVSPGRIVSIDDVRNLQKEDLDRAFRDPSGGVIPPKGSVPVMVLFVEVPEGLSEFGLDIVR